ncbi:MAG: DUF1611 domain-containing protein [Arenicellales bacterium]
MLKPDQKLAIHFWEQIDKLNGKTGHGVLRYSQNPIACVIDFKQGGRRTRDLLDFGPDVPIYANIASAKEAGADVLVIGMAPSGGQLPAEMIAEVDEAIASGMSIINGLHQHLGPRYPQLKSGQWVWDIRQEPKGLGIAWARAAALGNRRVLMVGTDMAIGKKTAGLEIWHAALRQNIRAEFLATGQTGVLISGKGIPLDAIRVDYACGAVEKMVLEAADAELAIIEGQGSVVHPGSTSTLPLIRGSCPTHLVLCHRAGMTHLDTVGDPVAVPPLNDVIQLYEDIAHACGAYQRPTTVGIVLNTGHLDEVAAQRAIEETAQATGRLTVDPIRQGADALIGPLMA